MPAIQQATTNEVSMWTPFALKFSKAIRLSRASRKHGYTIQLVERERKLYG